MGILLAFVPFIVFAVLSGPLGATWALAAGTLVSAAILVRSRLAGASPKILEIGTLALFALLALYASTFGHALSVIGVRLSVDCGLLVIVLTSIVIRSPFTIQYAREQVPREFWNTPAFMQVNYVITAAWAIAFVVMVMAEAALIYVPGLPRQVGVIAIVAALLGAVAFTRWYPKKVRKAHDAG